MKKRLICTLMIVSMLLAMLASCAKKPDDHKDSSSENGSATAEPGTKAPGTDEETEAPTETVTDKNGEIVDPADDVDENGYLRDKLPKDLNYGKTVSFLVWDGDSRTYEEFEETELSDDLIKSSLYKRNQTVESRLGVKLKFQKTKGGPKDVEAFNDMIKLDIEAGASHEYDIVSAYSRVIAMAAYNGYLADVKSTKYLDLEKPWWPKTLTNQSTVNGKLYFVSGDIGMSLFHNLNVIYFNKALGENYKITADSLYKLVLDGDWTLDKMMELCEGVYSDTDGDTVKSKGDTFGYIACNTQSQPIIWGCGIKAIDVDKDGMMVASETFMGDKMHSVITKFFPWLHNNPNAFFASSTSVGNDAFAQGRALFFGNIATYTMSKFVDVEFGILPNPKWNEVQEDYYTVMGNAFSLFGVPKTSTVDKDMCSAVLEAMGSEGYRQVSPAVFQTSMKLKYASDSVIGQMFDKIRASAFFDNGRLYSSVVKDVFTKTYNNSVKNNSTDWISTIKTKEAEINEALKALNEAFKKQ